VGVRAPVGPVFANPMKTLPLPVVFGLFLQTVAFASVAPGHTLIQAPQPQAQPSQTPQPQPLGSLSTTGEAYVNDQPAPPESTIFAGDKLKTGDGIASFTASGKGTLKIPPHSSLVFSGIGQYVAELKSGTVVVSSFAGPSGFTLRAGDFVVVPAVQEQQTTAKVEALPDGSFPISCLEGSVSVVSLQGGSGQFLQTGQSIAVSSTGQLIANPAPSVADQTPAKATQPQSTTKHQGNRKGWIILGLAGGGAAIAAAAAAAGGGGHQPVSPSSP
jgi:hypothetical protein